MAFVLQQFRVEDFEAFKTVFLDDLERRRLLGSTGARVFHGIGDEDEVVVLIEFESVANAAQFSDALVLREGVKWAARHVHSQKSAVIEEILDTEA